MPQSKLSVIHTAQVRMHNRYKLYFSRIFFIPLYLAKFYTIWPIKYKGNTYNHHCNGDYNDDDDLIIIQLLSQYDDDYGDNVNDVDN